MGNRRQIRSRGRSGPTLQSRTPARVQKTAPRGVGARQAELQHRLGNRGAQRLLQQGNPPAATSTRGTPTDVMFFIANPNQESNVGLRAALNLLNRYSSHVPLSLLEVRVLPEGERSTVLGSDLRFGGDSFWEQDTPVVRLPQEALDVIARHIAGTAPEADVHEVIRTVGHEVHHLWRAKETHRANPIQPVFEAEASRRMEQMRQNWVRAIQNGTTRIAGVPTTITRWEDIPASERQRIEQGASRTSHIQGLYERSAYIVEEICTKIEELAFLRVQQQHETGTTRRSPSRTAVSALAQTIYRHKNQMDSMADMGGFVTPPLWQRAQQAMLAYLRDRYPNSANPGMDSFEVLFFLNAMERGQPPVFADGRLYSVPPPGARLP